MWNGTNDPQEYAAPREENGPSDECVRAEGHEYQLLTRHADPPEHRGELANAICCHCWDQAWFPVED
jgi:hypothetical protein